MLHTLLQLDGGLLIWLQQTFVRPELTNVMRAVTHLGDTGMIWIALSLLLCVNRKTRTAGILSLTALALTFLADNVILKNLVARTRPYETFGQVRLLIERQKDFSFPSGHTGSSFAAAAVLFQTMPKRFGVPCVILAALIAFSRLYLGVHYPSDVLAGAAIGCLIALATVRMKQKLK